MARGGGGGRGGGSLRTTFLLVALAIIIPFVALIAYFAYAQSGREKGRVQQEALSQAGAIASQLEAHLTARLDGLTATAEAVAASAGNPAAVEAQVRRFRQSFPDFDHVLVLDSVGALIAAVGQTETR